MYTACMSKEKSAQACRYLNLLRNKAKRDYGFAYLSFLQNGACGLEPERGKLSYMAAQAVRLELASMELWGKAA